MAAENSFAMNRARAGFFASQKSRADLYALGPQSKGCDDSTSISDAAGSDHGDRHGVGNLRDEREGSGKGFFRRSAGKSRDDRLPQSLKPR